MKKEELDKEVLDIQYKEVLEKFYYKSNELELAQERIRDLEREISYQNDIINNYKFILERIEIKANI